MSAIEPGVQKNKQNMKTSGRRWTLLWILIPIMVVGAFILLLTHYLLDPDIYRNILQKSLTTALDREVSIGKAKIDLRGGVGIAFEDFRVRDRSLAFDLLQSKRLILRVKLLPLLKREIKWRRIVIDRPTLHVIKDKNGQFNIFSDSPSTGAKRRETQEKILEALSSLFGCSLVIRGGEIFFSDESLSDSPLKTEIQSFDLRLSKVAYRKAFPFWIHGKVIHSKKEGQFTINGAIQNIPEDMDFSKGKIEAEVKMKGIETLHFWPYLKTLLPMKMISGTLDLNAHYRGDFQGPFKTSAKITMKDVDFDYPQVFSFLLKPKWLNLNFEAEYDRKDFKIPRFLIELPEIWIKAKGRIYDIGSEEMGMEAEASTSPFDIAEGKKFIPFRIIVPAVSDRLFRSEGKGSFQAVSVKLSGKMPEIDHCDQPANAHVLSIEAKLDGAQLKLPWDFPMLEHLQGQLLFQKGHLYLKEVKGRIFHSTLEKVNGTFYELLHVPTLQLECQGKLDLMDLPGLSKTEGIPVELSRALSSIHILSGEAHYSLSAKGTLIPPIRLEHHGIYNLSKARFTHPQIPFPIQIGEGRLELSDHDLKWSEAKVEFGHSTLLTNGLWRHGEKDPSLEIKADGRMDLKNLFSLFQTPLLPEEVRSKTDGFEALSGISQFSFRGKSPSGTALFSYEGEFFPREVSLLQKGNPIPLVLKEGEVSFSNSGMGFSKTKIQSGNSSLTLDGWIRGGDVSLSTWGSIDLKQLFSLNKSPLFPDQVRSQVEGIQELNGGAEVRLKWQGKMENWIGALKEGEIRLKAIDLQHREIPVPLSHFEGFIFITPGQIRFDELKGKVGDSSITVSGTFSQGSPSSPISSQEVGKGSGLSEYGRLSFQIFSPQLDLDPLLPRKEGTSPASFGKIKEWLSNWSIDGKIRIDKGKYRSLRCQDLKGEMKTIDGTLFISPFQFKGDGGDFWGEGWIKPAEKGIRIEIKPRFSNMEARAFIRTLFEKGEEERVMITGRVHIDKAELRGEGENFQRMKESLNGGLRFEMENGVIERFSILSKIFSILNVSQLLKGRLPDLATKGLPYHQIVANFYVKDGVATTDDFMVDSDAMRITLLGKIDLGKNLIDVRVGVHPLVTIDTILSSVPIAGYILTGEDKGFISYFYQMKGSLDDPKIEAIPFKIVEESTWGIIKRLLGTPLRPFQKTPSSNNKEKNSKGSGVRSSEPKP
jgi:uncharacterized protein involved in outer membrane biogenesis